MSTSIARHHAEWLSLVEVSGPFLSLPVLVRTFPQGLEKADDEPEARALLRSAFEEWQDDQGGLKPDPHIHRAWVDFVLRRVLGFVPEVIREGQTLPPSLRHRVAEHSELLQPDLAIVNPEDGSEPGKPRLLVMIVPSGQGLEKALSGKRWKASPATRMMELLRAADVKLGLVTNGEHWLLVHAPRNETTGFAGFYATLWLEEPLTLRAFASLLSLRRFFAVAPGDTLEALYAESAQDQQEITDQLGSQVRRAVEVLIQAIDRIDRDRGRKLLAGYVEAQLYEAAVTVMMRLVFLLSAEERDLLPLSDPLYQQHYAISTLRDQLREAADRHGEEVLERRRDAWSRLLATFRAVHGGVQHEALRLPAYGGSLFDPDRFPFLEGRLRGSRWRDVESRPLEIHDRTVLHLLEALQFLEVRVKGGPAEARRLSFRALDIEQIGHVYESLLEHTAIRAKAPVLGLAGTKDREPEISLDDLDRLAAESEPKLIGYLKDETGRSEAALKRLLAAEPEPEYGRRLAAACDNQPALLGRVRRYASLLREDTAGYPTVFGKGAIYVTQGAERRKTGTHYTPRILTEPLVQYALEPLVYEGPAEGKPREEWKLVPAKQLLALRVCDVAMGSGAFLVQTCRYLSERLAEAWDKAEKNAGGGLIVTPDGDLTRGSPSERLIPSDPDEKLMLARRLVADRCLYGVDKNPMAVEMAKLSLWLITLQKDRPFTFLDHALRCGDSLIGLTSAEQIEFFHLNPERGTAGKVQLATVTKHTRPALARALELRRRLASFPVLTVRDAEEKAGLLAEAEAVLADVHLAADLVVGAAMATSRRGAASVDGELMVLSDRLIDALGDRTSDLRMFDLPRRAESMLNAGREAQHAERRTFHWVLEFPEVFLGERRGFDAIVGNPPFMGGQKITGAIGTDYRDYLVEHLAHGQRGSADLCAYFFLRAASLLGQAGQVALLATNTIAQGDTREVGLDQLTASGFVIPRAVPSRKWLGTANLEVAHLWLRRGAWVGPYTLDDRDVPSITPFLTEPGKSSGKPFRLSANAGKSFIGSYVLGLGFVVTPAEAKSLIAKDRHSRDVLFPYLGGEDLNSTPDQSATRWVINFRDWPLNRESAPAGYRGPVATDFVPCLKIVREKVKPERDRNNRRARRERWWQFAERCPELYATIAGLERVLVIAQTSRTQSPTFVQNRQVFDQKLVVFALSSLDSFAVLCSTHHYLWVIANGSTMRTDAVYTPSDCFDTFPFPTERAGLEGIGEQYHAYRQAIMVERQQGLTKTYNRFHDEKERAPEIQSLRELHVEMDRAVARAYGWDNLDLGHAFHDTKQGRRFTLSEPARREVLDRLLALNHQRHAEEVAAGLHDAKPKSRVKAGGSGAATGARRGRKPKAATGDLFGEGSDKG